MANEIQITDTTGLTLTMRQFNAAGDVWNPLAAPPAFETPADDTWADCLLSLPEIESTGRYHGDKAHTDVVSAIVYLAGAPRWEINLLLDAAVSSRAASATALTNATWTDARATKIDNLDAAVSGRLAASSYTAPDNASITAIKAKTDNLPASFPSNFTVLSITAAGAVTPATSDSDWTAGEKNQIRKALGITGTTADTSGTGLIDIIYAQAGKISTANINVISPTGEGTEITITQGDTFPSTEEDPASALTLTKADGEDWPDDLSDGWTIKLYGTRNDDNVDTTGDATITWTATVVTPTGTSQAIKFVDLTTTTHAIGQHVYDFTVLATKTGKQVTLRSGTVTVKDDWR
jgi:hypothetical protein